MGAEVALGIDVAKAIELRFKGLSFSEIGKLQGGVSPQAVQQRIARFSKFLEDPQAVTAYRDNEAQLLDGVRMELITSLVDDVRAKGKHKLSGYQKVGMYGILFDKMRLLRNESTANVSNLTAIIQAALGENDRTTTPSVSEVSEVEDAVLVPQEEAAIKPTGRND